MKPNKKTQPIKEAMTESGQGKKRKTPVKSVAKKKTKRQAKLSKTHGPKASKVIKDDKYADHGSPTQTINNFIPLHRQGTRHK